LAGEDQAVTCDDTGGDLDEAVSHQPSALSSEGTTWYLIADS
jgi:hypothetical protein